ncbi:MAG: glycine cleavage system aminomethyltransferase GcvT [Thermoanaerobaculia bacterium]|nr:glycine cleavage system aminomethyltransferase GcvT [Thermoanaerobaculia bacterium]
MNEDTEIKSTPLLDCHRQAGGKIVEFAGWWMPVQYSGVIEEHQAVRQAAGLFDVSHMGEFSVRGPQAEAFLQRMTPNDVTKLVDGRAHYSGLLTEEGTYVDDVLIYRLAKEDYMVVVNAGNQAADFAWLESHLDGAEVELADHSKDTALLALQGPKAPAILAGLTTTDLSAIRYYGFAKGEVAGHPAILSRTGYTGEDGFELYLEPDAAGKVWDALLEAGAPEGLVPAGLGARDTLRLEAAMALYGHELDRNTTPWEAGLDWVVKLEAGDFLGRDALVRQKEEGVPRRLIGIEVTGRGIAREGYILSGKDGVEGIVTSGTWSPTLEKAIGLGYLPTGAAEEGEDLRVTVRKREVEAKIVAIPFYKRPR